MSKIEQGSSLKQKIAEGWIVDHRATGGIWVRCFLSDIEYNFRLHRIDLRHSQGKWDQFYGYVDSSDFMDGETLWFDEESYYRYLVSVFGSENVIH